MDDFVKNAQAKSLLLRLTCDTLVKESRIGGAMNSDGVTQLMETADIPLTIENYLATQFMGDVPPLEELDEEFLQMIPEMVRSADSEVAGEAENTGRLTWGLLM